MMASSADCTKATSRSTSPWARRFSSLARRASRAKERSAAASPAPARGPPLLLAGAEGVEGEGEIRCRLAQEPHLGLVEEIRPRGVNVQHTDGDVAVEDGDDRGGMEASPDQLLAPGHRHRIG